MREHGKRQSKYPMSEANSALRLRRLGIDTYREFVVYMNRDCEVCRSEGFEVRSRVGVKLNGRTIVATLNVVSDTSAVRA